MTISREDAIALAKVAEFSTRFVEEHGLYLERLCNLAVEHSRKGVEPVAWVYTHVQSGYTDIKLEAPEIINEWNDLQLWHAEPLYTHPAPSDEALLRQAFTQLVKAAETMPCHFDDHFEAINAIRARLKGDYND